MTITDIRGRPEPKYGTVDYFGRLGKVDINEPEMTALVEMYLLGSVKWSERHSSTEKEEAYYQVSRTVLVQYERIDGENDYILTLTDEGREFVTKTTQST